MSGDTFTSRLGKRRMQRLMRVCLVLSSIGALSATAVAQPRTEPLSPKQLFAMKSLTYGQSIALSADGRYLAYVSHDPTKDVTNSQLTHISQYSPWTFLKSGAPPLPASFIIVRNLQTGFETALRGSSEAWAPVWANKTNTLAFLSDKGGCSTLWVWTPAYLSHARRVSKDTLSTAYYGTISWSADDQAVFLSRPKQRYQELRGCREAKLVARDLNARASRRRPTSDVRVLQSGMDVSQGAQDRPYVPSVAFANAFEYELMRVDLPDGKAHVLARQLGIDWLGVSPDGQWLLYASIANYKPVKVERYLSYY